MTIEPVDPNVREEDKPELSGQNVVVLNWMRLYGWIGVADAEALGIHRLAARIHDLRAAGFKIESVRTGRTVVYSLAKADQEQAA